ncbi:IS5 family transposase [Geothrix sp. PMB-07]|uniref:IS5 family transposase n=1 Tax=Geothrix sp. PMB-07 TaxID=3068640 RepID=UPI0035577B9F
MWARLEPLLPSEQGGMGRPRLDNRPIVEAILWKHRTGAPWRDLPESFGPWNTVFTRFNRWNRSGVWQRVLEALRGEADCEWVMVDGMGIDGDVQMLPANAPLAGATVTMDPVSRALGPPKLLDVEVKEAAWLGDLVAPGRFLLLQGRPPGESLSAQDEAHGGPWHSEHSTVLYMAAVSASRTAHGERLHRELQRQAEG